MQKIWVITRRELNSYFDSLMAYIMIIIFLVMSGIFTWLLGTNIFFQGQASLQIFFGISFWTLFFFIPAITMRTLAEENKTGTIELLSTKAIKDWDIVLGKFFACLLLVSIALLCTLPYYFTISQLGNADHGGIIGGYLGLLLLSASYISVGIFSSSTTNNQIIAFLIAIIINVFFQLIFDFIAQIFTGSMGAFFNYMSLRTHFESLSRGVIDSRDIIYFASIISLGLLLSQVMLSKRNWQA